MKEIFLWLPGMVPSVNKYYRHTSGGTHYMSPEGRTYKTRLGWEAKKAGAKKPMEGWVSIEIEWHCTAKCRGGDLDNRAKVIMDALEGVVYENDYYVAEIKMRKVMGSPFGEGVAIKAVSLGNSVPESTLSKDINGYSDGER